MTAPDVPMLVFSGPYTEAIFLKTLLESAGIETSFQDSLVSGAGSDWASPDSRLYVRQADIDRARELVEHFLKNGRRMA